MRIARGADVAAGSKLLCCCFAKNDGPCSERTRHDIGIGCWSMRLIDRRVVAGDKVGGVNNIFDANGDAMKQAAWCLLIKCARARKRRLRIKAGPSEDIRVNLCDTFKAAAHKRLRR